jgi:hypothetical protein
VSFKQSRGLKVVDLMAETKDKFSDSGKAELLRKATENQLLES